MFYESSDYFLIELSWSLLGFWYPTLAAWVLEIIRTFGFMVAETVFLPIHFQICIGLRDFFLKLYFESSFLCS